jgi:hypothetical protein
MPKRSSKRQHGDANESAHAVVQHVINKHDPDATDAKPARRKRKNPAAVALGRKGGLKGGRARAASMTPEQRAQAARKAALFRWSKRSER